MIRTTGQKLVGLFAVLGTIALVVASCGGEGATATPSAPTPTTAPRGTPTPVATATAAPTPTAAPRRGGTLTLRLISGWPIRDSWDTRGAFAQQLTQTMMNQLVMTNPYNFQDSEDIIGDLAQSWQVGADGLSYTFKVQQGTTWHDGRPFTAKDVVYSYNRALNPPAPTVTKLKSQFASVASVEAPDDATVAIKMKSPSVPFLRTLALPFAHILPAHVPDMAVYNKTLVGTGPFKLKSEDANAKVEVARNPDYFKRGLPYLDAVTYSVIPDPALAFAAFRQGQVLSGNGTYDFDWAFPQASVIRKDFPDIQAQSFTPSRFDIFFNSAHPALADKRVRTAINIGFDRQEFDRAWTEGRGSALASPLVPAERGGRWAIPADEMARLPGFNAATKVQDVARAKELLAQAGASGLKLRALGSNNPIYGKAAEIAVTLLRNLGIESNLSLLDTVAHTNAQTQGAFDINPFTSTVSYDDPADHLTTYVRTGGGQNYGKWSFPKLDQLLDEQDRTFDVAKRRQLLLEVQRIVLDELPLIPLNYLKSDMFSHKQLKNMPRCYFPMSPCYKWEQVWIEPS